LIDQTARFLKKIIVFCKIISFSIYMTGHQIEQNVLYTNLNFEQHEK